MDQATTLMLEQLRKLAAGGLQDRFKVSLKEAIDKILAGQLNIQELSNFLAPLLRDVALSEIELGNVQSARLATSLMCTLSAKGTK